MITKFFTPNSSHSRPGIFGRSYIPQLDDLVYMCIIIFLIFDCSIDGDISILSRVILVLER